LEATGSCIRPEELFRGRNACPALLKRSGLDVDTVDGFEERLGDAEGDKANRAAVFSHLVNRQNTVADEVGLGESEIGENKTRAIAENHLVTEMDRLEVLRLTGGRRNRNLLGADKGVDGGGFTNVGVTN
jgi:hypothetical protein